MVLTVSVSAGYHPNVPTPVRSRVTKTTPVAHGKSSGETEGHPGTRSSGLGAGANLTFKEAH